MSDKEGLVLVVDPDERRRAWLSEALLAAGLGSVPERPADRAPQAALIAAEMLSPALAASLRAADRLMPVAALCREPPDARTARDLRGCGATDALVVRHREDVAAVPRRMRELIDAAERKRGPHRVAPDIAGTSPAIEQLRRYVASAAATSAAVLVLGESGTGKELVARAIHRHGARSEGPFVAINCSAIAETLLESEMFGHEKGSFTGASGRTRGFVEQAANGTLFLDEIGEMSLAMQARLLRALQPPPRASRTTREITRVGGEAPLRVDVRLICATHRDLDALVRAGRFREDLLQRIDGLRVLVPPLRERGGDVVLLAQLFLEQAMAEEGREGTWIDDAALAVLREYRWPRNVRELEALIHGVVALKPGGGPIVLGDLPLHVFESESTGTSTRESGSAAAATAAHASTDPGERPGAGSQEEDVRSVARTLADVTNEHVLRVLRRCGGNRTHAARILGITRQSLGRALDAARPRDPDAEPDWRPAGVGDAAEGASPDAARLPGTAHDGPKPGDDPATTDADGRPPTDADARRRSDDADERPGDADGEAGDDGDDGAR